MSLYNPSYPNLELMEYKFKIYLKNDEEWCKKVEKIKNNNSMGMFLPVFEALVFPQTWGSTNTAFDVCKDGSPAIGGCAMTKAYTVVFKEVATETYAVFVNNKICYMVWNPTDEFYRDLNKMDMKSLSKAKEYY